MVEVTDGEEGGGMVVHYLCGVVRCVEFWYVFQNSLKSIWLVYKSVSITKYLIECKF